MYRIRDLKDLLTEMSSKKVTRPRMKQLTFSSISKQKLVLSFNFDLNLQIAAAFQTFVERKLLPDSIIVWKETCTRLQNLEKSSKNQKQLSNCNLLYFCVSLKYATFFFSFLSYL